MHNQHYISYSIRRVAQCLILGADIVNVREVEKISGDISTIAAEWKKLGKEGPIYEFTLGGVTPEMKKRMREIKYGREPFTDEELKRFGESMRLRGKGIIRSAFDKVHDEIRLIEKESWQLRSRTIAITGSQKPWRLKG